MLKNEGACLQCSLLAEEGEGEGRGEGEVEGEGEGEGEEAQQRSSTIAKQHNSEAAQQQKKEKEKEEEKVKVKVKEKEKEKKHNREEHNSRVAAYQQSRQPSKVKLANNNAGGCRYHPPIRKLVCFCLSLYLPAIVFASALMHTRDKKAHKGAMNLMHNITHCKLYNNVHYTILWNLETQSNVWSCMRLLL